MFQRIGRTNMPPEKELEAQLKAIKQDAQKAGNVADKAAKALEKAKKLKEQATKLKSQLESEPDE
jgi:hypothetical protein